MLFVVALTRKRLLWNEREQQQQQFIVWLTISSRARFLRDQQLNKKKFDTIRSNKSKMKFFHGQRELYGIPCSFFLTHISDRGSLLTICQTIDVACICNSDRHSMRFWKIIKRIDSCLNRHWCCIMSIHVVAWQGNVEMEANNW